MVVDERIGVLLVHGIGEQRTFEHLESEVRNIVRAIRAQDKRFVTIDLRTTQDTPYHAEQETWRAEGVAPLRVHLKDGDGRVTEIEFREVWWADLDEPASLRNNIRFWAWGLSMWLRRQKDQPVSPGFKASMCFPGAANSGAPAACATPRPVRIGTRLHLFFVAWLFVLVLPTFRFLSYLLNKLGLFKTAILPADMIVRYMGDVRLYQQDRRSDLWPLVDMGRPPRVMIRRRVIRAFVDMALARYDRWYVLAHSLGSVVAYNGLTETAHSLPNYIDQERWDRCVEAKLGGTAHPHTPLTDVQEMMPLRPAWLADDDVLYRELLFDRLRGVLTYGCPLDKFAALFPLIVPQNRQQAVFPAGARWVNVYDPTDPVGGNLDEFAPLKASDEIPCCHPGKTALRPINYGYAASIILLVSHIRYLSFKEGRDTRLVHHVAKWILTDTFHDPTGPEWLSDTQIAVRKAARIAQDGLLFVLLVLPLAALVQSNLVSGLLLVVVISFLAVVLAGIAGHFADAYGARKRHRSRRQ